MSESNCTQDEGLERTHLIGMPIIYQVVFIFYRIEAGDPSTGSAKVFHQVKKMTLLR